MTRLLIKNLLAGLMLYSVVVSPLYAGTCNSIGSLSWLLGHWESRNNSSVTTENWIRVSENEIEIRGMSLSLPDFSITFLETIEVVSLPRSVYYKVTLPQATNSVLFKLTSCTEGSAVFENGDHDFPSRIAYYLEEAGRLRVDVSGPARNGFSIRFEKKEFDRRIALTFDDAPRSDSAHFSGEKRSRLLIESLKNANSPPVIFFSTSGGIDKQGRDINYVNLGKAYVESLMESVRFYADMAEHHLGLGPAHTLLLHENDLVAMFIGDLIRALQAESWTIIDARKAYEDPIANIVTDTLFNGQGRVAAMARVKGVRPRDLVHRAEDTIYLEQYFEEKGVFGPGKE